MISIIQITNALPDCFKKFCSILNMMSCYTSLVKSMVTCYVVYKSEAQIKKYIEVEKVLIHFKALLTRNEILELSSGRVAADKDSFITSREEYFIEILHRKDPKFIEEMIKYLALGDCSNHLELYHHLQSVKDEFHKSLCIPSAISHLPGIKWYQDFLKRFYTDMVKAVQDTVSNSVHQYVNLSLMVPQKQEKDNKYFKDPHHLLFNYKQYTTTTSTPFNSLAKIFNVSDTSPQVILIQGSPGSGKTTLANKICIEWAKGNLIQHYILVILLKLRDPRISDIESIDEVISCSIGDSNFVSEVVRDIKFIDGENVLLLLEGWDELPEDMQQRSFFTNIISGKVLKKCNVLITSRPSSIGSIQKQFITRNIAIVGFTEDQIEQYLDHCFADSGNKLKDSLKYKFLLQLNTNPKLKSLAYVPVNLSILVHVYKQYGGRLPSTLTELYKDYVLVKLSLYNQRIANESLRFTEVDSLPVYISESLNKLCELAYGGLKTQKLHFTQNEMLKLYPSIPLDYDGMGLLQVENHMLNRGSYKTYNFLHRTVQEFLAAWHMAQTLEQNIDILRHFQNTNFEAPFIFYAGLTGFKCLEFTNFLPFINSHNSRRSRVMKLFENAGLSLFKVFLRNYNIGNFFSLYADAGMYCEHNGHGLLVLIACCAEAKNPAVCRAFSNSELFHSNACYINIPYVAVTSQLLCSLSYCIAHSTKNWLVNCDRPLSEQDILGLQKYLIVDSNDNSGKLMSLTTTTSKREIYFLVTFLQPYFCLFHLDLSDSHEFGDYCATLLAKTLEMNCSLVILSLNHCDISSEGILAIGEMLCINSKIEIIQLLNNRFSCDDLVQILAKLENNSTLTFMLVDASLQKLQPVTRQLTLCNRVRRNHLRLNVLQLSTWSF